MKISTLLVAALLLGSASTAMAQQEVAKGDLKFEDIIQSSYSQTATPMVVTSDKNVVVTGTQVVNESLGAFVAKAYSQLGSEAIWKIDITGGRSIVNTIIADNAGGVYIGGNFNDEISLGGKTLSGKNSSNYNKTNGFVAHITSAGKVDAAYAFVVSANPDMLATYPDAYSQGDKVYCSLSSLTLIDGKPYAGLIFTDVLSSADGKETLTSGTWDCINYGMGVGSDADFAVVELDPTTLEAKSFPVVFGGNETRNTENYWGINVESAKMTSDGKTLYFAATVNGYYSKAVLKVGGEVKDEPTFKYSGGLNAVYVASVDMASGTCLGKVFDGEYKWSATTSSMVKPEVACLDVVDDAYLYIGGSFYQNFPFNPSVAAVGNTDIYIAGLNKSDLSLKFAHASGYDEKTAGENNDEKFSCYTISDPNLSFYGAVVTHNDYYSAATTTSPLRFYVSSFAESTATVNDETQDGINFMTGAVKGLDGECNYYATLSNDQTDIYYFYDGEPANGISTLKAEDSNSQAVYNLQGMKLRAPQKGLNIIGGKAVVVK